MEPALYCTPCCFNQWQACSQDTQNRGYCTVSVVFFFFFERLFLSHVQKTFALDFTCAYILFVDRVCLYAMDIYYYTLFNIYIFHYDAFYVKIR